MQDFTIVDDDTGMEVTISGDQAPAPDEFPELFAAARKQSYEKLASGEFKLGEDLQHLDKAEQRESIRKHASRAMGISPQDVDIESGMGMWDRTKLSFQPTDADRMKQLEDDYGKENVSMLQIGDKQKMFYRDPKTKKMTMVDEMGASLADFTADIAGTALPIAGAIGAAVATGGASIPLMAGAAALGGFAASAGQDIAVRAGSDEDIRLGEIAKRRGIEAAIGIPIDLVTGGFGRVMGKAFAKRSGLQAIDELTRGTKELNEAYGTQIKLTAAQSADPDASITQSLRAGLDPRGREAQWYNKQLDEIGKIDKAIKTGVASDEPVENVMARMADEHLTKLDDYRARMDALDEVKINQQVAAKKQTAEYAAEQKTKMKKQRQLEHEARVDKYETAYNKARNSVEKLDRVRGGEVRGQVERQYASKQKANDDLYEEAYRRTDTPQANTPVADVQKVVDRIDEGQFIADSAELRALQALKKRIADNPEDLTFRELDAFVRQFGDRVNFKKKHGLKFDEINFRKAYGQLNKLWNDAIGAPKKLGGRGAGKPAKDAHMAARKDFRENILPYTDGEPSRILQKRAGGMAGETLADEKVLTESLSTSASVRNSIAAGADRNTLKDAYMRQILQQAEGGKRISYDESVLDELYKTTSGRAGGVKSRIAKINQILEDSKKTPDAVTREDLRELVDAFDAPAARKAEKAIRDKIKLKEEYAEANRNVLTKIIKGEQPAPEDIHIFISDIAKLRPSEIQGLFGRLSPAEQNSLKRSGIDWFLEKAGASKEVSQRTSAQTGGLALWEPDAMEALLRDSATRSKLEALLGKDIVSDYAKANKVVANAAIIRNAKEGASSRVVLTTGASGIPTPLIVSPGIPRWLGRKMLGVIHTSSIGRNMLRRYLQSPNEKSAEDLFKKMFFTSIGTRAGMASAADEAGKDPQFSAWLQESFAEGGEGNQEQ